MIILRFLLKDLTFIFIKIFVSSVCLIIGKILILICQIVNNWFLIRFIIIFFLKWILVSTYIFLIFIFFTVIKWFNNIFFIMKTKLWIFFFILLINIFNYTLITD